MDNDRPDQATGIIYARVSSQEQVQGTSLEMQESSCQEYAKMKHISIIGRFTELGESAKSADRTQFQKALEFCSKNKPDYFIVHKIDRFARNQEDHVTTQMLLRKFGTKLRSVTEQVDESPVGKMLEGVLASFAEFDNNVRASRSKSGMVEKVKRGEWVWQAPLGYKRLSAGMNLVPDEEYAPYIQMAFEEWSKGTHTYRSLAEYLHKRGFRSRSGKKIYQQGVEKIIRNPIYYGMIRAFDMEVAGSFESLISEDLFWKCQPGRVRRVPSTKRKANNPNFPLKRIVVCAECGASLTGSCSTGRSGKRYAYYHHHNRGCSLAKSFKKETVENEFVSFLGEISPNHSQYEKMLKAIVVDVWKTNYKKLDADNARIRKDIEKLETQRQSVFESQQRGVYTDQEFLNQKKYLDAKILEKKLLLNEKVIEEFDMEEALSFCFDIVRDSGKTWLELAESPDMRLRFQKLIFPEKIMFDGEKFGTSKMSLVYKLNETHCADSSNLVTLRGIEPRFPG